MRRARSIFRIVMVSELLLLQLVFVFVVIHSHSNSKSNHRCGCGSSTALFTRAFTVAPLARVSPLSTRSLLPLPLPLAASSGNNPHRSQSTTLSASTTSKSSVGRLRFCYDRLRNECPDEDYLRETPSLVIAADLLHSFSEKSCSSTSTVDTINTNGNINIPLDEQMCIAVLDAYMVAYRDARKTKAKKARFHRNTREYADGMDAVVDGMQSVMSVLTKHDERWLRDSCQSNKSSNSNNGNSIGKSNSHSKLRAARTVDPYATILHMLLELTLDASVDGDAGIERVEDEAQVPSVPVPLPVPLRSSSYWAAKSVAVLASLESNRWVATPDHAHTRLLQYNKVLKGLANANENASSSSTAEAVRLLDRMCGTKTKSESSSSERSTLTKTMDDLLAIVIAMETKNATENETGDTATTNANTNANANANANACACVVPDAKSFATVLASPFLSQSDLRRLIRASIVAGVYKKSGYLEKFLVRSLGNERLAEILGLVEVEITNDRTNKRSEGMEE